MNRMRYLIFCLITGQLASILYADSWRDPYSLGRLQFERGLYTQAIADYEIALRLAESPRDRATVLYCLAVADLRIARFSVAEQEYKQALDLFRREGDSTELAVSLAGLGETYRAQYRLDEALAAERHALAILKLLGKEDTYQAGDVLSMTGEILNDQHRFKEAERCMREALAIHEKTLGPEHPDFATSLHNLGAVELERKHAPRPRRFSIARSVSEGHGLEQRIRWLRAHYSVSRRYIWLRSGIRRPMRLAAADWRRWGAFFRRIIRS
jgi:tetratricopeptide (TPR) repeat protein